MGYKTAMTLLYAIGILQTFIFNKSWTFKHHGERSLPFIKYISSYMAGYVINLMGLIVFVDNVGLPHQLVQGIMVLVVAMFLFLMQKFWVFKGVEV
jgi:putative flippase GtrA